MSDRLGPNFLFKLIESKFRFSADRTTNHRRNFIDPVLNALRGEKPAQHIFQARAICLPKLLHAHDALEKTILTRPWSPNACPLQLRFPGNPKISPRRI